MATETTGPPARDGAGRGISPGEVRAELERVLRHPEFQASERLRSFLTFVVEESLAGRADGIKGRLIAHRVFGRGEDFDGSRDAVVRVEAGRLRLRLEHYYFVAGKDDPIRIDIPKGGYAPRFLRQNHRSAPGKSAPADESPLAGDPGPTLAIVPFRDLTAHPDWSFFGAGLVAEIANEVNRYENVVAVPARPLGAGGGGVHDFNGARFLLEGSVRRDEVELKIVVHLTDTVTVRQLWGESYKVPLEASHLIEVQEELARDLMSAIADEYGVISRRLTRESRHKPPAELSTFEALLRYYYYLLVMTADSWEDAFLALRQATEREPDYGPAWAALANLHAHAWIFDRPGCEESLAKAFEYARRGVTLAPGSQLARTILAYLHLLRREIEPFADEAEAALALNPNSPNYAGTIGYMLAVAGEIDRASALLRRAFESGPSQPPWFHHGLFIVHYARGDYQEAFREIERALPPTTFWDCALRAAALGKLGRVQEAEAAMAELLRLKPDFGERFEELATRTPIPPEVGADFLDGLSRAGMPRPEA
jgi:adenylate cyclase